MVFERLVFVNQSNNDFVLPVAHGEVYWNAGLDASTMKINIPNYSITAYRRFNTITTGAGKIRLIHAVNFGDNTSQFDITNPTGNTMRYTWDTNGTNPEFSRRLKIGDTIVIDSSTFDDLNNGSYTVTNVDADGAYFEISNAPGFEQLNKVLFANDSMLVYGRAFSARRFPTGCRIEVSGFAQFAASEYYTLRYGTVNFGDLTTNFDIINTGFPNVHTMRYTWDGVGKDPKFNIRLAVDDSIVINSSNFIAANNGTFTVTAIGTNGNYFEITNSTHGADENNKTLGADNAMYIGDRDNKSEIELPQIAWVADEFNKGKVKAGDNLKHGDIVLAQGRLPPSYYLFRGMVENIKVHDQFIEGEIIGLAHLLNGKNLYEQYGNKYFGDNTSQFDISNPGGTTFRYTWDGNGLDPTFDEGAVFLASGDSIVIDSVNFNAFNNGTFVVTAVDTNGDWFEVTNAAGVVENNKTLGSDTALQYYATVESLLTNMLTDNFSTTGREIAFNQLAGYSGPSGVLIAAYNLNARAKKMLKEMMDLTRYTFVETYNSATTFSELAWAAIGNSYTQPVPPQTSLESGVDGVVVSHEKIIETIRNSVTIEGTAWHNQMEYVDVQVFLGAETSTTISDVGVTVKSIYCDDGIAPAFWVGGTELDSTANVDYYIREDYSQQITTIYFNNPPPGAFTLTITWIKLVSYKTDLRNDGSIVAYSERWDKATDIDVKDIDEAESHAKRFLDEHSNPELRATFLGPWNYAVMPNQSLEIWDRRLGIKKKMLLNSIKITVGGNRPQMAEYYFSEGRMKFQDWMNRIDRSRDIAVYTFDRYVHKQAIKPEITGIIDCDMVLTFRDAAGNREIIITTGAGRLP